MSETGTDFRTDREQALAPPGNLLDSVATALMQSCETQLGVELGIEDEISRDGSVGTDCGSSIDLGTTGGSWAMVMVCSRETADTLARLMFDVPADETPEVEDVEDVLCEVVNIAGGLLKSVHGDGGSDLALGLPEYFESEECTPAPTLESADHTRYLSGGDGIALMVSLVWKEEG